MAGKLNAQNWANNWAAGVSNDSEKLKQGIQSVTENPCTKAADNKAAYLAGVQRSVSKWETNLRKVSIDDWKNTMLNKGIANRQMGISTAKPKVQAHAEKAIPIYERLMSSMPKRGTTPAQNLERVKHMALGLHTAFTGASS